MADRRAASIIRAAGGVVWRVRRGRIEVALVHRPRYDDWSLPKGKLDDGETELAAAVREVREELGSDVAVSRRITRIDYPVGDARKRVTYWVMRHLDGQFVPSDEVDDVRWLPAKQARSQMSYGVEREVMTDFVAVPIPESVIVLVRHAKAGKRSEWRGNDLQRPLEATGKEQAERLVDFLSSFCPDRVISADVVRCIETVQPLADELGLTLVVDPVFSDERYARSAGAAETAFYSLAKPGKVSVVCSQGVTIPGLLERVSRGVSYSSDTRKGAAWVLSLVDGTVVSADYYDDAARSAP